MTVGGNTFFPKRTSINFTIKNNDPQHRTIKVFNSKIKYNNTIDLLSLPSISEADIRHALIKGDLANLIRLGIIEIVSSSIDLIQFDDEQHEFVESAGVKIGGSVLTAAAKLSVTASFPLSGGVLYTVEMLNQHHVSFDGYQPGTGYLALNLTLNTPIAPLKRMASYSVFLLSPTGNIESIDPFLPVALEILDIDNDGDDDERVIIGILVNGKLPAPGSDDIVVGVSYIMFEVPAP